MKVLFIYHYLGLGDHVICNGLVRHFAQLYDVVYVFSKPHNVGEVERLFVDTPSIKIISADNKQAESFIADNPQNEYLIIRGKKLNIPFDKTFYKLADIPFEYKWSKFYFKRDLRKERVVYTVFDLKEGDEYIFVHDDKKRGFGITKQLPKGIKVVTPNPRLSLNIVDYIYIIEHAKEVHCMDSCFLNLVDCMLLRNEGLFFHKYIRKCINKTWRTPNFKLDWRVLE